MRKLLTHEGGQALVELSIAAATLCVFVFGIIDFGRAIYDVEVMHNLVGEGSSMALRGTDLATTATTVATYAGADISISSSGCVIVTAVTNVSGSLVITGQASHGGLACTSKVGCLSGQGGCVSSNASIPATAATALLAEASGTSLYATEIFYSYTAVTPLPALLGSNALPSTLYSVAYY